MLLLGALFALFLTGFWLYCLTDAVLTPVSEYRIMPKLAWIVIITLTFAPGAVAWLLLRRPVASPDPQRSGAPAETTRGGDMPDLEDGHLLMDADYPGDPADPRELRAADAEAALLRHPAGRSRASGFPARSLPTGPDDDPDFLRTLDWAINLNRRPGEDA
jgi:hypothetical protein